MNTMMMSLSNRPNKLLGQHFLICEWVLADLAKATELKPTDTVLEIGPGTGALTRFLASRVKKVIAVEKDTVLAKDLADQLKTTYSNLDDSQHLCDDRQEFVKNVEIIAGDILHFDFSILPAKYKVVANIPYYLTSRLIRVLLEQERKPEAMVLTIQREVAERIIARPPQMNLLGLAVQAYARPEIMAHVPASCFRPRPQVDSAILRMSDISDEFFNKNRIAQKDFFVLAKAGFSSRRKMLVNNLERFGTKKDIMRHLESIGHPHTARAQELSPKDWARLACLLSKERH